MKIMINGERQEVDCTSLEELVAMMGHASKAVATALNGEFVPIAQRASHALSENDAIEIIAPMAGG